jgi:hypothetical protein
MTSRIHRRWNVLLTPDLRTATIHYIVNENVFFGLAAIWTEFLDPARERHSHIRGLFCAERSHGPLDRGLGESLRFSKIYSNLVR